MGVIQIVFLLLLIASFAVMFTKAGRMFFDVMVLICLVLLLAGVL